MNTTSITPMDIKVGIKRGFGIEGFCSKYSCSPDDLERRVRALYKHQATSIMSEIRDSGKKQRKPSRPKATKEATPAAMQNATAEAVEVVAESADIEQVAPQIRLEDRIAELKVRESDLSNEAMSLENQYCAVLNQHKEHHRILREIQADLSQMEQSYNLKRAEYDKVVTEDDGFVKEINRLSGEIREKWGVLAGIRAEIETLSATTICVYANGDVAVFEGPNVELSDLGYEELFSELKDATECDELRVRDIRTLARVIKIVGNSSNQLGVLFENDEVELVYGKVSGRYL